MNRHASIQLNPGKTKASHTSTFAAVALTLSMLSGCDQLGIDTPATIQARAEQEGKAVGTACRHAMRAMEDCYAKNSKIPKSAIAAGWREMDEYMRENNIAGIAPAGSKEVSVAQNNAEQGDPPTAESTKAH